MEHNTFLTLQIDESTCDTFKIMICNNNICCTLQILGCMMDPLIQMCSVSASHLSTVDMATYMVNCIYLIQSTLALYEFTDQRLEMLQAQVSRAYYDYTRCVVHRSLFELLSIDVSTSRYIAVSNVHELSNTT